MKTKSTEVLHTAESVWDSSSDIPSAATIMKLRVNELLRGKNAEFSLDALQALRADITHGLSDQAAGRTALLDIAAIKATGRRTLTKGQPNGCP